jgi:hypothetical protein
MYVLSNREIKYINSVESDLLKSTLLMNEENHLTSDLVNLRNELTELLTPLNACKLFDSYVDLLSKQLHFYDSKGAYMYGKLYYYEDIKKVVNIYFLAIDKKMDQEKIELRLLDTFDKLSNLLGDSKRLLSDYTDVYRIVNGTIYLNIGTFIRMGMFFEKYGNPKKDGDIKNTKFFSDIN